MPRATGLSRMAAIHRRRFMTEVQKKERADARNVIGKVLKAYPQMTTGRATRFVNNITWGEFTAIRNSRKGMAVFVGPVNTGGL